MPFFPNVVSSAPLEVYRTICAISGLPEKLFPMATILPSGCSTILLIWSLPVLVTAVLTIPLLPNVLSSVPFVLYRTRVKSSFHPLLSLEQDVPASISFPSDG